MDRATPTLPRAEGVAGLDRRVVDRGRHNRASHRSAHGVGRLTELGDGLLIQPDDLKTAFPSSRPQLRRPAGAHP